MMVADILLNALSHVWRTLEAGQMKLAVMGDIALASWKYVRATRDVDLLVGLEGKTLKTCCTYFKAPVFVRVGSRRSPALAGCA